MKNLFPLIHSLSPIKGVVPVYHTVSDENLLHVRNIYKIRTRKTFLEDLDFLLKHYEPTDLQSLINQPDIHFKKPVFHLTFDDGLREIHDNVMPVLIKKGVPATIFISPGFLDNKVLFHRFKISLIIEELLHHNFSEATISLFCKVLNINNSSKEYLTGYLKKLTISANTQLDEIGSYLNLSFSEYLCQHKPYLTHDQVQDLCKNGFTVGAHSENHPEYFELNENEMIKQTLSSVDYVTKQFDVPYKVFAFPFTDFGVPETFFEHIYSKADILLTFGTAGIKRDKQIRNIQRLPAEKFKSLKNGILDGYLSYPVKKVLNKHFAGR